jgi:hypothetical protein
VGPALGRNRFRHRHRPHGRACTAANWSWIFPPKNSPTKRPFISARRANRNICGRARLHASPRHADRTDPAAALKSCSRGRASPPRTGSIANTITWCATARWFARLRRGGDPHQGGFAARDSAPRKSEPSVSNRKIHRHDRGLQRAYVYLDPYEGAKIAVAEVARNLACSGAVPLGSDGQSEFRQPAQSRIVLAIAESVRGLAEACKAFNAPVTGGNCSLYNQSPAGPIDPTPTVAMVGLIEKPEHITTQWFKDEGDAIILLGDAVDKAGRSVAGPGRFSAYLQVIHGLKTGTPPRCDLERSRAASRIARLDSFRPGQERARLQRRRPGRGAGGKLHLPANCP